MSINNQPDVAPGVPGMNAYDLVNLPIGPEAKAFIKKSNAEKRWLPKCFRCLGRQKAFDGWSESLKTFGTLGRFLGTKTVSSKLSIGKRPEVADAKWWIFYRSEFASQPVQKKAICDKCAVPFSKEKLAEQKRWAKLPGRSKTVDRMDWRLIICKANKFGLDEAQEGDAWHYDPKLRKGVRDYPKSQLN